MATALVTSLAQAIYRQEGSGPNTLATINNNPGNLRSGPGQVGTDANGYAIFASMQDGWNALYNQVQINIDRGLTLNEFFAGKPGVYPGYAPAADSNQPYVYASNVSQWTGIDPNTPLNQLDGTAGATIVGSSTQPLVSLSGPASATPTPYILTSIQNATGIDLTDTTNPVTDAVLLAAAAGVIWLVMGTR